MFIKHNIEAVLSRTKSASIIAIAVVMSVAGLAPMYLHGSASAATLSSRSVAISTSQASAASVDYNFTFTQINASTLIRSLTFQFCNTPLGTCVLPGTDGTPSSAERMDVDEGTASVGSSNWTGTDSTAFADYSGANAGGCSDGAGGTGTATMFCATRASSTPETAGAKTFQISGIRNPIIASGNNEQVYVRITTYSDAAFATPIDDGTVAASIVNQLTVSGRVQERLVFCVFALDDTAGSSGTIGTAATNLPTDCTASEATASSNVDLGVIDNSGVATSPVNNSPPTAIGNDRFGAALINTNASNGITLTYYATAAGTGTNELRAFRVPGATCDVSGTSLVDQCFISADDSSGESLVAGTERFGMQMACVTNSNTTAGGIGTTSNLGLGGNGAGTAGTFNTVYANGDTALAGDFEDTSDDCESEAGTYAGWHDSGTAQALISSTTVVDDEMVKMRFLATANPTTPTGSYTVATTYIATPVF